MDRKRQTLKAYASHVSKLCPKHWTANKLHAELCNSTSPLTSKKVDLNRPCTGSETQFCHIYDELSLWNEALCHCHMQIKEVAPKELAISAFHGRILEPGTAAKYALVLVHWLLKEHHCLKALRIQGSVILENSELLCDALRLAVGLKSLEIWGKRNIRKFYRPVIARQRLLRTIGTLAGLEELKLNCVLLSKKELAILKTVFENMTCLRSFVVTNLGFDLSMASQGSFPLMEGLKCCKTITELYLGCSYLFELLSTALAGYLDDNCTLRDLTLDLPSLGEPLHRKELAPMLGALARNKALQKLHLIGYSLFELQHQLVVEAMTANQTLQSLHITDEWSWVGHKNFPDIIKNNSGLLELALEGPISKEVKSFTEAICVNKTMQKLSLNWSGVTVCDTKEFCSALAKNQSLQMVVMSNVDEKLVEGVYNVLKETGTEHRVHFTSIFKSTLVLQEALENCSELTEVCYCPALHATVRTDDIFINSSDSSSEDEGGDDNTDDDNDYLRDDGNTDDDNDYLRDDGNTDDDDDYLRDGDGYTDDEDNPLGDGDTVDDDSLGGDNIVDDDMSSDAGNENSDHDYRILNIGNNRVIKDVASEIPTFRCLNTSKHLVKLVIMMNEKMCEESAELLAQFLASTKTLKCATLSFPTTESSTQSLLDGLLSNKSISKLELGYWCFKDRHAEDFAQVLRGNNTLNHLTLHHMSSSLILQELAKCIADNKFLLGINFDEMRFFTCKPWMIRIMDTLRRNSSLLQCAVYFVVGNHSKRCGEAFEQLFQSRTLLEKVQELDSESESVAKERILNSKRHLDINFLAVAGVVKSRVACSRGNGSQMKLDEIGVDNWLLVRSYLKLTDIKNASDEPCPPP
ncbi:unnamed protein product, partial [Ixodes persulcatus]